jgi:hypothetical protein
MGVRVVRIVVGAFLSYIGVAVFQTWPLARHLSTHLSGLPGGDAGVYVWNTWVFRHQLVDLGQSPFSTGTVLPLDGDTSLSLHNYTIFADLLTLPLQPLVGVVAAFNLVYILNVALCGLGMFLLASRFTDRKAEAWLAGLLFACSPFLVARGASHFSLAAAAPLPFFLYFLDRAWSGTRLRDAVAAGIVLAWAACSDPYYGVYCVMLAAVYIAGHVIVVSPNRARATPRHVRMLIDLTITALVAIIVAVRGLSDGVVTIGGLVITMRTLYTPVLLLTILVLARAALTLRPTIRLRPVPMPSRLIVAGAVAALSAALLLLPELYAMVVLAAEGRFTTPPVLWRSSAPGLDLLAFLLPNPNHPLAPHAIVQWLASRPGGFDENVASVSFVAVLVIAAAWALAGFRASRLWVAITLLFGLLALGPFVEVAGWRTSIPTPWTLLRYVPFIGEARMPQRFAVVVSLGLAVIFASALTALGRRFPQSRQRLLVTVAVLLVIELLPAPRRLYSAAIPDLYRVVAADPRPVRVLELPFGIRDGLSSMGNFTAASQFYQTFHGKPLLGGYLSRVPQDTKDFYRSKPMLRALIAFSERRTPRPEVYARARAAADDFLDDAKVGYVVLDTGRATPELRTFAIETLGLTRIARNGTLELYRPRTVAGEGNAENGARREQAPPAP